MISSTFLKSSQMITLEPRHSHPFLCKFPAGEKCIFNLENNIFQVVGVECGFTPSLLHFPLDIWKSGGSFHMKTPQGMLFEKFEFNSYGRLT